MEARAIQRSARQSARKMRLVIDLIRGRAVPEAYAILKFSKKLAAKQIHKVLQSAVANAEQKALRQNEAFDADLLRVKYAVINEGQTLKRFTMAAMGRGTPIKKRTSHVEIHVASEATPAPQGAAPAAAGGTATAAPKPAKAAARGGKSAKAAQSDKPAKKKKAPAKTKKRSK